MGLLSPVPRVERDRDLVPEPSELCVLEQNLENDEDGTQASPELDGAVSTRSGPGGDPACTTSPGFRLPLHSSAPFSYKGSSPVQPLGCQLYCQPHLQHPTLPGPYRPSPVPQVPLVPSLQPRVHLAVPSLLQLLQGHPAQSPPPALPQSKRIPKGAPFPGTLSHRDPSQTSIRSSQWSFSTMSGGTQSSSRDCCSWTRHPLIQKNRRVVLASFLLLVLGLGECLRPVPPGHLLAS